MATTVCITAKAERDKARMWVNKAPLGTVVKFSKHKRTVPQNDRMWAMLTEVAAQKQHNGKKHSPEVWKALFMHACGHETRFEMGLNGEPFPVGFRSSQLNKEQMGELMDFIECKCAEWGVSLSERGVGAGG